MDRLLALLWGESGDGVPHKLKDCGAVFAAGVAHDPGDSIERIEFLNFLGQALYVFVTSEDNRTPSPSFP